MMAVPTVTRIVDIHLTFFFPPSLFRDNKFCTPTHTFFQTRTNRTTLGMSYVRQSLMQATSGGGGADLRTDGPSEQRQQAAGERSWYCSKQQKQHH
jgi:hypothetical protein